MTAFKIIASCAILLFGQLTGTNSLAQEYPSKAVTIINPFLAGGPTDLAARALADYLSKPWNKAVVVENRPGGGALIGTQAVVDAPPDGHTLLLTTASINTFKALVKDLRFEPLRALSPISVIGESVSGLITNGQVPARNIDEFIVYAKANPGKINFGSTGRNSAVLVLEGFKRATGAPLTEIPYTGTGAGASSATTALIRNDVQLILGSVDLQIKSQVDAGILRPLLVLGKRRSRLFQDVQTTAEKGMDIPNPGGIYLLAPSKSPSWIIQRIAAEVGRYKTSSEGQKFAQQRDLEFIPDTPELAQRSMENDVKRWAELAALAGIQPE